jgi:hypothetical protein
MLLRVLGSVFASVALRWTHALFVSITAVVNTIKWLSRRPVRCLPARIPGHIGVVLGGADRPIDIRRLATLIKWCTAAGVQCVTVCDVHGDLMSATTELRSELHAAGLPACTVLAPGEGSETAAHDCPPHIATSNVAVRLLALRTGRDDLVNATRRLYQRVREGSLQPGAIDEAAVEAELSANAGFPEPVSALHAPSLHPPIPCRSTTCAR